MGRERVVFQECFCQAKVVDEFPPQRSVAVLHFGRAELQEVEGGGGCRRGPL